MSAQRQAPGHQFPCDFTIKAMGLDEPGFEALVVELVTLHCDQVRHESVSRRPSRNGKYVAVSVGIQAQSMDQLNAIYAELTAHERILMRL